MVLDCEYSSSKHLDKNITLKWYFQTFQDLNINDYSNNGQSKPSKPNERDLVYEWIPRFNFRYVSTNFQQHFDWDFHFNSTGEHNGQAFRALPLLRPLVDHSGRYTCQVSSTMGVEEKTEDMLVFGELNKLYKLCVERVSIFMSLKYFVCKACVLQLRYLIFG